MTGADGDLLGFDLGAHKPSAAMKTTGRKVTRSTVVMMLWLLLLLTINPLFTANAFLPNLLAGPKSTTTRVGASSSPLADKALASFPFVFAEKSSSKSRRLTEIPESQARNTFNEMARVYGDEQALQMVQVKPLCLIFDAKNFGPCLDIWSEIFGLEKAHKMVARNPGLLGIPPELAAENADATMALSYVIGIRTPYMLTGVGLLLAIVFGAGH